MKKFDCCADGRCLICRCDWNQLALRISGGWYSVAQEIVMRKQREERERQDHDTQPRVA